MSVTVIVSLKVADFNQWKATFDGHAPAREAAGINAAAHRNLDDEGNAVAIGTAPSKEAFIAFERALIFLRPFPDPLISPSLNPLPLSVMSMIN